MTNCGCSDDHLDGLCPIDDELDVSTEPLPALDLDDPDEVGTPVDDEELAELLAEEGQ